MDPDRHDPDSPLAPPTEAFLAESETIPELKPSEIAPAHPRVMIEYRTRGLPWPLVLPLLGLAVLIVVAGERQLWKRDAILAAVNRVSQGESSGASAGSSSAAPTAPVAEPQFEVPPRPEPLSASSLPITERPIEKEATLAPDIVAELVGPPRFKEETTAKSQPPVDVATVPAAVPELIVNPQLPPLPRPPLDAARRSTLAAVLAAFPAATPTPKPSEPAPATPATLNDEEKPATNPTPAPDSPPASVDPPAQGPLPTREEVLAEVQAEADRKQATQDELRQLKREAPEFDRKEHIARVREQRGQFLTELKQLISSKKKLEPDAIDNLSSRYIQGIDPELEADLRKLIKRFSGRTSIQSKISAYRAAGVPEPMILNIICNDVHRRAHFSRCTCFDPQMYVLAARELIASYRTSLRQSAASEKAAPGSTAATTRPASSGTRLGPRSQ